MKKDIEKLQGTWNIATLEVDGQKMPSGEARIVIQGTRFTTTAMGATYGGTIAVDETKTPKTFDLNFTSGPEKGNTNYGIYELEGETWKICLSMTGKDRPKKFATQPGSGHALEILQREKSGTKQKKAAKPEKSASQESARSGQTSGEPVPELGGEWSMASCVINGQALDAGTLKYGKRVAKGNEMTVFMAGSALLKARFTVDRTKSPMAMDYELLLSPNEGKSQYGIYELDGENLRTCFSPPGLPRPDKFASAPGDGRTFTVWKRVKK